MLPPMRPRPIIPSCITRRPPVDPRDAAAALLQRLVVARRLRADQAAKPNVAAGDRQLVAGVVDDLEEEAGVRPALVQLPGRVQVARPEAVRDDAARRRARGRRAARSSSSRAGSMNAWMQT